MRDNRLPGVLAREKHKREAYGCSGGPGEPARRPWHDNRGIWFTGVDRKQTAAARNMTKRVTGAR